MKKYLPPLYLLVFSLSLSIFPQQNDFERWGIDLILRENEISPSIVVDYPMVMYRLVRSKIHTTLIIKDPNNNDKLSVSWSGAITLFGYLTGVLLNLDDFDRESRKALRLAIIIPCLLINSEPHIFFISPQ